MWRMLIRFWLAALLISLGGVARAHAEEISYPPEQPRFTLEVPKDWKSEHRGNTLVLTAGAADGFLLQIEPAAAVTPEALKEFAARFAAEMKLAEVEIGTPAEAKNQHGIAQTVLTSQGKLGGSGYVVTLVAFSIGEQHYVARSGATADVNRKHMMAVLSILDSVKPAGTAK
jgi:hypothetical protein